MPVSVHVPTRVRVDAAALRERRDDLADALGSASRRALAGSVENVLDPRSSYARVRLSAPEFTWLGAGLDGVPASLRDEIELLFAEVLVNAASDAGVQEAGTARPQRAEPVVEPIEDDRYNRALALYTLPSYAGGEVRVGVGGEANRIDTSEPRFAYVWRPIPAGRWIDVYLEKVEEFGVGLPADGYKGAIYVDHTGSWSIFIVKYPETRVLESFELSGLTALAYDPKTRSWSEAPAFLSPSTLYELRWVADGGPGAEPMLRDYYGPAIREILDKHRGLALQEDIDRAVIARTNAVVAAKLAMKDVVSWVELRGAGERYLIWLDFAFPREASGVDLIPLVYYEEIPPTEEKGAGAGTGTGPAKGTATAGGAAGAGGTGGAGPGAVVDVPGARPGPGLVFPSTPGGEVLTLVCEPFLGEPKVGDLGTDGVEMRRLIEAIARGLDIEPCEYAGTFLLNAVSTLAGRAASVAKWDPGQAEAMRATPAGDGNLGHVDFVPSPSLQILFLRHLATVVPDLDRLNQWLTASYQEHGDLIRGSRQGEPISWLIQFHSELNRSADRNVGWLFVVTCQVVLLQLLASSRQEIHKRIGNAAFAQNFEQVLLPQLETVHELQRAKEVLDDAELIAAFAVTNPALMASAFSDVRLERAPATPVVALPGSGRTPSRRSCERSTRRLSQLDRGPTCTRSCGGATTPTSSATETAASGPPRSWKRRSRSVAARSSPQSRW